VTRRPFKMAPPLRCPALRKRTPEQQALLAEHTRTGETYEAHGPVAGGCGHAHIAPGYAARCVSDARPTVRRRGKPAPFLDRGPAIEGPLYRGSTFELVVVLAVLAWVVWTVWF
jgi:hypothetical protein